jgi:tryptophanyl-tRNA synthetase
MSRSAARVLAQSCQRRYNSNSASSIIRKSPYKKQRYDNAPRVFSGIQPTGVPHLGNYLGALRQWVDLQTERRGRRYPSQNGLLFSIVDLHALTAAPSPELLMKYRRETLLSLFAIGLNTEESTIFFQSSVNRHPDLQWILSNVASMGYLSRMTQWKSKLALSNDAQVTDTDAIERLRLGLFSYPVLQAADILMYGADLVPVGEDQLQHIEFARHLARAFNAAYPNRVEGQSGSVRSQFFRVPEAQISVAKRVMSLRKPTQKMSKSDSDPNSRILITDSEEAIRAKIKGAVTDSEQGITYDVDRFPGTTNLVDILRHVERDPRTPEEVVTELKDLSKVALKERVADAVVKELTPIRDRYRQLDEGGDKDLVAKLASSQQRACTLAFNMTKDIRTHVGLGDCLTRPLDDGGV